MAGMEQLEIHSKSYIVRWISVPARHSISWSVQPHKKSINFGVFKHPGTKNGPTSSLTSSTILEPPLTPTPTLATESGDVESKRPRRSSASARNDASTVLEKLQAIGLKPVAWAGRCEADRVSMGRYDVKEGEDGMYGLVFDNTFSKQASKNVTFVLMTHPTNAPPKSGHSLHYSQAFASNSAGVGGRYSPNFGPISDSTESLPHELADH
ncbi:hypothetical protein LTR28_001646, partial [Elasticomyces elasticus]